MQDDDWLPISSAPKDGTNILLYSHGYQTLIRSPQQVGRWHTPSNPKAKGFWVGIRAPTHWKPLGPPPQEWRPRYTLPAARPTTPGTGDGE